MVAYVTSLKMTVKALVKKYTIFCSYTFFLGIFQISDIHESHEQSIGKIGVSVDRWFSAGSVDK